MLLIYGLVCLVNLIAVAAGWETLASIPQVLAMLVLIAWLVRQPGRTPRWLTAALVFSWLGDTLPRFFNGSDQARLASLAVPFLFAQICFIRAFWPWRRSVLAQRRWLPAIYLVALIVLIVISGKFVVLVIPYGVCLTTMAILANAIGGRTAVGGTLFFCSDLMIGLGIIGVLDESRPVTFAVMATYWAAQLLLVTGAYAAGPRPVRPVRSRATPSVS